MRDTLDREGWLDGLDATQRESEVVDHASAVLFAAASYDAGAILRKNGSRVYEGIAPTGLGRR